MDDSTNYVAEAERVIKSLINSNGNNGNRNNYGNEKNAKRNLPTTSQLRKFLAMVNALSNKVLKCKLTGKGIDADLKNEILFLKAKLLYQAKDRKVKTFVDKANMLKSIEYASGGIRQYERFAKYVEALVAYHKYYGGE